MPALYVLIASVSLMLVAFGTLMVWQGAEAPSSHADWSQAASRKQITGSEGGTSNAASSANSAAVPNDNPAYPQRSKPDAN